ncbi:response regulator [Adhaeribacter sp. BT258]|uniref:Response regulator n=1 Tax=Adhaeribacter terrigena TaxID=2793070 RepID=A0ABS1C370_9BACT|nr:response regulator [Adhaeribacter terrigena]MBK0403842.1 response regulator [Adhaeribacter terrigena]
MDDPLQILLVEDNRFFQKLISDFAEFHGFDLQIAENGKVAIQKLQQHQFNLILMDVEMPEMDGYEATEFIRRQMPHAQHIPIIMITSHEHPVHATKSLLTGANSYLKKPFREDDLLKEIETLMIG